MRHIQRYIAVRNLHRNGHTKDSAFNEAVDFLAKQRVAASPPVDRRAVASRRTIEASYDKVERSLKRQGRESSSSISSRWSTSAFATALQIHSSNSLSPDRWLNGLPLRQLAERSAPLIVGRTIGSGA